VLHVTVNDQSRQYPAPLTVAELLDQLGLEAKPVAVELNRELVPKAAHDTTELQDGDAIEIVSLTGGG